MLKLLLLTLSTWSVVSCCFLGAVGLLLHRREQRALHGSLLRCGIQRSRARCATTTSRNIHG